MSTTEEETPSPRFTRQAALEWVTESHARLQAAITRIARKGMEAEARLIKDALDSGVKAVFHQNGFFHHRHGDTYTLLTHHTGYGTRDITPGDVVGVIKWAKVAFDTTVLTIAPNIQSSITLHKVEKAEPCNGYEQDGERIDMPGELLLTITRL